MNIFQSFQLSRDRNVTVANLVDELLRRNGDCEVSIEDGSPYRLVQFHSEVCSIDAFLRRNVELQPGQPVAIYRTNDRRCFRWFLAIIRAGGIAVPLNPMLSLPEVSRILADSGTDILITDKAVFDRTIGSRDALNVRTWIQSDDEPETLDGFLRAPNGGPQSRAFFPAHRHRSQPRPSPSSTPPAPADFPKAPPSQAAPCSAAVPPLSSPSSSSRTKTSRSSRCPGRTSWRVSIALYGLMAGIRGCFLDRFDVEAALDMIERHRRHLRRRRARHVRQAGQRQPRSALASPAYASGSRQATIFRPRFASDCAQFGALGASPAAAASRPCSSMAMAWSSSAASP